MGTINRYKLVEPFQADYQATLEVVCRTVREQY